MRTLFISDIHLGCIHANKKEVLKVLKKEKFDKLVLVGDIIDFWQLSKGSKWQNIDAKVLSEIIKISFSKPVIYCCGNHDDIMERINLKMKNVVICKEYEYNVGGKKYLVTHGDIFDYTYTWIEKLGDFGYYHILSIDAIIRKVLRVFKARNWSLAIALRQNLKSAITFLSKFESYLIKSCKARKYDGVICGHVHVPANRIVDGIHYLNCGDWFTHNSYIIEENGEFTSRWMEKCSTD